MWGKLFIKLLQDVRRMLYCNKTEGVPDVAFQYQLCEMTAETTAVEFVRDFVRVEKFLPFCQQCGNYNTRWTCPPFDFDPVDIWNAYTGLRLYARVLRADAPEQPLDAALEALGREKRLYRQELQCWERQTPGSQMLLAGTCDQCKSCEKAAGRPCRRPELLRYSIEALGGDVEGCSRHYFHLPILWGRDGKAPEYFVLVGGLLMK